MSKHATTHVLRRPVGTRARSAFNMRPHMWEVMCALSRSGPFTIADVRGQLNTATADSVRKYLRELHAAGYVSRRDNRAAGGNVLWQVLRPQRQAPRLRSGGRPSEVARGQQLMWNAMRRLRTFDWHELAAIASTEDYHIAPGTARRYMGQLHRGGYLSVTDRPRRGQRGKYKLVLDTGPRAPCVVRVLHDPNTDEIIIGEEHLPRESAA